jgi:hypothetical protein
MTYQPGAAWQDDVALEMWIEAEHDPVHIRLRGTLDQSTVENLVTALNELIGRGCRDFEFETCLDARGVDQASSIAELTRIVERCGGRSKWGESTTGD